MFVKYLAALALILIPALSFASVRAVTVPMTVDHARVTIPVSFVRTDGSICTAKMYVDSGNPDWVISEKLARDLHLDLSAPPIKDDFYGEVRMVKVGTVILGGKNLDTHSLRAIVPVGQGPLFPGMDVDGNLPSTLLERYDIILDYPKALFTLADAGSAPLRGLRLPARVNSATGMIAIDCRIRGKTYPLALDNGAAISLFGDEFLRTIASGQPAMPEIHGAIGDANMFGSDSEAHARLYQIPQFAWGGASLRDVGVAPVPKSFIQWYSTKTPGPVFGLIGGNVLSRYRVTISYSRSMVSLSEEFPPNPHDMDMVGLILRPEHHGIFTVIGKAKLRDRDPAPNVQVGDTLLTVGNTPVSGLTLGKAIHLLRGKPGSVKRLTLERNGRAYATTGRVYRYW